MSARLTLSAIAAAAITLGTPAAFATSSATATLGPIQVTLFDLNPLDNVTPSVTFTGSYGYGDYVYTYAYDSYSGQYSNPSTFGVGPFDAISSTTSGVTNAWATAAVSGPGTAAGSTLSASGIATGTNGPANGSNYSSYQGYAYAPYYYYSTMSVSANTLVLLSMASSITAQTTAVWDPYTSYAYEYASGNTYIQVYGPGASGTGQQSAYDSRGIGANYVYVADPNCTYGYCYHGQTLSDNATMSVSFVNATSGDMTANVYAYAGVSGSSYAPAVPEPGTTAMLLAGLAAVGFMVRRRA